VTVEGCSAGRQRLRRRAWLEGRVRRPPAAPRESAAASATGSGAEPYLTSHPTHRGENPSSLALSGRMTSVRLVSLPAPRVRPGPLDSSHLVVYNPGCGNQRTRHGTGPHGKEPTGAQTTLDRGPGAKASVQILSGRSPGSTWREKCASIFAQNLLTDQICGKTRPHAQGRDPMSSGHPSAPSHVGPVPWRVL